MDKNPYQSPQGREPPAAKSVAFRPQMIGAAIGAVVAAVLLNSLSAGTFQLADDGSYLIGGVIGALLGWVLGSTGRRARLATSKRRAWRLAAPTSRGLLFTAPVAFAVAPIWFVIRVAIEVVFPFIPFVTDNGFTRTVLELPFYYAVDRVWRLLGVADEPLSDWAMSVAVAGLEGIIIGCGILIGWVVLCRRAG